MRNYLEDLITQTEIRNNRRELYSGMPIVVYNTKSEKIEDTKVNTWYENIICCDNGSTFTMAEYAIYKRNPNKPLGGHWSSLAREAEVKYHAK